LSGDLEVAPGIFYGLPELFDESARRHAELLECLLGRGSAVWCPDRAETEDSAASPVVFGSSFEFECGQIRPTTPPGAVVSGPGR